MKQELISPTSSYSGVAIKYGGWGNESSLRDDYSHVGGGGGRTRYDSGRERSGGGSAPISSALATKKTASSLSERFGSGSGGQQLSQLYGFPSSSVERCLGVEVDGYSSGEEHGGSGGVGGGDGGSGSGSGGSGGLVRIAPPEDVTEPEGGLRVQHLLRTSQVHHNHNSVKRPVSGKYDSLSEKSSGTYPSGAIVPACGGSGSSVGGATGGNGASAPAAKHRQ